MLFILIVAIIIGKCLGFWMGVLIFVLGCWLVPSEKR